MRGAGFVEQPFRHIYIDDFFSPEHIKAITQAPEICLDPSKDDEDLFDRLFASGYKIIDFPGCITDRSQYMTWHKDRRVDRSTNTACAGFGMTLRLMAPKSDIIADLHEFLVGDAFRDVIAEKFGIDLQTVSPDSGIQKYLDGYEISPHPDIRRKALTYMVNINPHAGASELDHHTHYLTFRDGYKYVQSFWEGNPDADRCWVPWDWCSTTSQQTRNNSIVIFSPNNDTIHAVKANYDHLQGQRTQLYGNLWYKESRTTAHPSWEDLVIGTRPALRANPVDAVKALVPASLKDLLKSKGRVGDGANVHIRPI